MAKPEYCHLKGCVFSKGHTCLHSWEYLPYKVPLVNNRATLNNEQYSCNKRYYP